MAVSQEQKVDFLLKKLGFTKTKTGLAVDSTLTGTKKAGFAEAIPSPLIIANSSVWNEADSIPATPPSSDTNQVRVYLAATSGHRMTVDTTVANNRAFIAFSTYNNSSSTRLDNWIDTQFGAGYLIKVFKGDPNSGGVQLSAAGSGQNDGWFFDYSAGVLNFNDTNVPSGVQTDNIYVVGYRYIGQTGAPTSGISTFSFLDLTVERNLDVGVQGGISTFRNDIDLNADLDVDGHTNLDNVSVAGVTTFNNLVKINKSGTSELTSIYNNNAATLAINDTGAGAQIVLRGQSPKLIFDQTAGGNGSVYYDSGDLIFYKGVPVGSPSDVEVVRFNHSGVSVSGIVTATGVDINGDLDVDGHTNLDNVSIAGVTTFTGAITANAAIDLNADLDVDGHTELDNVNVSGIITSAAARVNGTTVLNGNVDFYGANFGLYWNKGAGRLGFLDNATLSFGHGLDTQIKHDNSNLLITNTTGNIDVTGNVVLNNDLDVDGHTNLDNVSIAGVTTHDGNVKLNTNKRLYFGSSGTSYMFYQSSGSTFFETTGGYFIQRYAVPGGGHENMIEARPNNSVLLFFNGSEKFKTTSTGIDVTGDATFSGNVSIGGTLTYEDVKNIDAVGLITARSGIRVTGGVIEAQAGENKIPSLYSAMSDLPSAGTYHGMFAHVHATGRGYFAHAGNWMELVNKEVNGVVGTGTETYNIGNLTATGADINGDLDVDGHTNLDNVSIVGVTTFNLTNHPEPLKIISNNTNSGISTYLFTANAGLHDIRFEHNGGGNWNTRDHMRLIWSAPNETTQYPTGELFSIHPRAGVPGFSRVEYKVNDSSTGLVDSYTQAYEYHQWKIRNSVVLHLSQSGIGVTNRIVHYGYNNDFIQFGHHNMQFHIGSATDRRVLIQSNQVQFSNLANGVDINADLDVDGHTNLDNVSISGVTTAFRIRLEDNRYLQIGNDSDLQLYHDGTNSYINEGGTGSLFIAGSALRMQSNDNRLNDANGNVIIKTDATSAYLYYEGSNRLNSTSVGINIPEDLDVDGHTNLDNVSIAGVSTFSSTVHVGTGTTIETNGQATFSGITTHNFIRLPNYVPGNSVGKIQIGDSNGYEIFHYNNNNYLTFTRNLLIRGDNIGRQIKLQPKISQNGLIVIPDGAVELYHNGTKRLETSSVGISIPQDLDVDGHTNLDNVSVAGVTTFVSKNVHLGNSSSGSTGRLNFGSGNPLQIFYDSNTQDAKIVKTGGSGNLDIQTSSGSVDIITGTTNTAAKFTTGSVQLYRSNSVKLATTNTGITVTGTAVADGADINGDLDVDGHTNLDNVSIAGVTTFATNAIFDANARFNSTIGVHDGTTGGSGQYLRATGTGVTWASFPSMRTSQSFTASAGQTTFSFTYNVGFLDVFVNGIKLSSSEFTANNGSSVVLSVGSFVGDIVELVSYFTTSYAAGDAEFTELVQDTSPQLGGDLDLFNKSITGTGNVNITGIITATQFKGDGSGLTGIVASGSGVIVKNSGTTVGTAGTIDFGTNLSVSPISSGIVTITASGGGGGGSGISTISGIVNIANDLDVDGHTNLDNVSIAGFTTITQDLDVDGHTNLDNVSIAGVTTFASPVNLGDNDRLNFYDTNTTIYGNSIGLNIESAGNRDIIIKSNSSGGTSGDIILKTGSIESLKVNGDGGINVVGHSELDNVNIAGVVTATTFKGAIQGTSGTFSSNVDITGDLDVDGHTDLDNLNVAGVSTFTGVINASGGLTGTASVAQNLVVEDESSDTSCNVLFTTAASGNLPAKTGTNLTFNSSTGNLSATKFTGDGSGLTGVTASGSGVVVQHDGSNIGTAGTINFSTNLDVSAISAGIVTITASGGGFSPDAQNNLVTGTNAGANFSGTDANHNILMGYEAGNALTTADNNIAIGYEALKSADTEGNNVAIGYRALKEMTSMGGNVAIGYEAGYYTYSLYYSVAVGFQAMSKPTQSGFNTWYSVAVGANAMAACGGDKCVAIGYEALDGSNAYNSDEHTAVGYQSLSSVQFGSQQNTALGALSGKATSTGDKNIYIGYNAGNNVHATGDNCIIIGSNAAATSSSVSNEITLGDANITKLRVPGIGVTFKDNGGTPTQGHVLTVDANGEASFAAASGGGGGTNVGITTNLSGSFTASAGSPSTINTFGYGGGDIVVEYTVFIKNGSDFQTQKLLAMRDGTTIHSTQFAVMFSSSLLVQLDATISSGNILLRATPETGVSGSTTYKIKREVM